MAFDIKEVIAGSMQAIKGAVKEDWPQVRDIAAQFLIMRQARLELLASFRLAGQITDDEFKSFLEDEKKVLESELHAIAVIAKAVAQRAANEAIEVLWKAVQAAIPL